MTTEYRDQPRVSASLEPGQTYFLIFKNPDGSINSALSTEATCLSVGRKRAFFYHLPLRLDFPLKRRLIDVGIVDVRLLSAETDRVGAARWIPQVIQGGLGS